MNKTRKIFAVLALTLSAVWAQAQSLSVWADDVTVTADGKSVAYLYVNMTDANELYSGFQMAIDVPEGIHIAQKVSGRNTVNDATLNKYRFEGLSHTLSVNMPSATLIKVGGIDLTANNDFFRDDAEGNIVENLFAIGLTADNTMEDGNYTLKFSDVKMIHGDATYNAPDDFTATLTIVGGIPTSIKMAGADQQTADDYYDLTGKKVKETTGKQLYIKKGKKVVK